MAFFKSFQQSLPSVNISSLLDTVSSRVDDLASAVSDATYTVSDQLTEQVSSITTIISKAQAEDEEDKDEAAAGQEGKSSAAQEGKANSSHGSKNNQSSNSNADGDSSQSQLEWEWRDGCWRVKKSEAEIEKEEKEKEERMKQKEQEEEERSQRRARRSKKRSQNGRKDAIDEEPAAEKSSSTPNGVGSNGVPQCDDDDHKEPPQSPHPQDDSRASKKKKKKGVAEEEEEVSPEKEQGGVDQSNNNEEPPQSPCPQEDTRASKKKKKKGKAEAEEEMSPEKEESPGGEEEQKETEPPTSPTPDKKKKSDKKNGTKEDLKKSEQGTEKEKNKEKGKEKSKKKKKKDKSCPERGSSDSEEDVPGGHSDPSAQEHGTSLWDNRHKHSKEHEGYSSETSTGHANSIQRIRRNSPLNELQPPPYQDEDMPVRVPRPRSGPGGRRESSVEGSEASEASADQDTESYLNKGYEEDVPSDSTAVLGPEDGSAPQLPMGYEPEPLAKYGTLDVAFEYDSGEQRLAVTVTAATDIPVPKQMGNISWQVHLVLLPTKKQRAKTGVQKGPCPVFTETFRFSRVEQDTLGDYAIRFRLYSVRRMKKEKVLGEKVFYLTKLNLKGKMALPVTLEPGSTLTGCGSMVSVSRSAGALSYRSTGDSSTPEILLGLIYNSTTGRLSAEVVQGSHFKNTASDKPPNTYVKLTMLDSKGKEMSKCKTSVCRGQPNPTYKETFVFQVALFQLSEVSLVVSVYSRRSSMKPRERLGWVSMGLNSTGEEQQTHWSQMKEAEGQQVSHWHTLMDT